MEREILFFFCLVFGCGLDEHSERHQAECREVRTHARIGRPIPDTDKPVAHEHKVGEEEKKACCGDGYGRFVLVAEEITDRFTKHGSDDQRINEANNAENGIFKRDQRREEEDCASDKDGASDYAVERSELPNKAVCDHEANVAECEDSRAGNKLPVDEYIAEKRKEKTCHHGKIEFHVGFFRFISVNEIDRAEDGKERAAGAFEYAREIQILIQEVHEADEGNQCKIDRKHDFFGIFHCSPR